MSEIASLSVTVGANISGFTSGMTQVETGMSNLAGKVGGSLDKISTSLIGAAGKLSLLTAPLAALGLVGVNTAMQFDSAMAEIGARTGATEAELEAVRQKALQMGADTAFSAQDAATAFLELLSSGQTLEEAMATIEPVMTAAAASGEQLGTTADGITNVMAMFGLEAENASMVVDALAKAAGASSADMASLIQGFNNGGAKAAGMGIDVEDTAAILAIFAENGKKGAEAGTLLSSMITGLNTDKAKESMSNLGVSLYDNQGNAKDFEVVLGELKTAMADLPAEEQNTLMHDLAGSYGETGLRALLGSISIGAMKTKMDESTGATEVADAKMNTFAGTVDSLKGSIETLSIEVMTPFMNNVLKPMVEEITKIVNAFTDWAGKNPEVTSTLATLGLGAVVFTGFLFALGAAASVASAGIGLLSGAFLLLSSPIVLVGLAIGGAVALIWWARDEIMNAFREIGGFVQEAIDKIKEFLGFQGEVVKVGGGTMGDAAAKYGGVDGSHAMGLASVPFDGYVAQLHKGEMVVPAREAGMMRAGAGVGGGGGGGVTNVYNINSYGRNPSELMEMIKREARNGGRK